MEAGIVGLPNVGKSTLFNALTAAGAPSANYPFCTIEPNVGVVAVPDERLDTIARHIPRPRVVPAMLRLVDIAGLVRGASEGEGLGNRFLSHIRTVDAILHVVRCFEDADVAHVDGNIDPMRDIDTIDTELLVADLSSAESALDKAGRPAKSGDKHAQARVALLRRCVERLGEGIPLRGMTLSESESALMREFGFLTAKPVLYVANVAEDDLHGESEATRAVRSRAERDGGLVVPVCASLEAELIELEPSDRDELLESVGLSEPALHTLARAAYELLGLQSFFTAGEKEIRAWAVPKRATAPEAAGVIHSDFQRGFIRVEVYSVADLEHFKSEKAIREAGRLRIEGKEYRLHDGDVCHFLFNV